MIEYTDAELDEFEELALMLQEMTEEEVEDFISSVAIIGNAKKKGFLITDNGNYYN
jgi:ribose 5-phosphate isomerase